MPISSIVGSTIGGASAAVASASKAGGQAFADVFQRAKGATSANVNSATTSAHVGELTRDAENLLSEFKRSVQQLFANSGIDPTWEIHLHSDGNGGVQVGADHPDCEKIEQLLRENPDLIEKFKDLQKAYTRLRSSTGTSPTDDAIAASGFSVVFADDSAHVAFD